MFLDYSSFQDAKTTLVELVIAASLILLVLSLSYSIYLFGVQGYLENAAVLINQCPYCIGPYHL